MRRVKIITSLLTATLVGAAILITAPTSADNGWAKTDLTWTVSSDGSMLPPAQDPGRTSVSPGFPGTGSVKGATSNAGVQAIYGPDDRVQIRDTTSYPASATVLLTFTGGSCSGFMISARTVATAAHCVHTGPGGTWRTNVVAYPGHNGTDAPFGSCPAVTLFTTAGWTSAGGSSGHLDYGAVRLNCTIGNQTGWYGLLWTGGAVAGTCVFHVGYPHDKALTPWRSVGLVLAEDPYRLYYRLDTAPGQDGGPMFVGEHDWCRVPSPGPGQPQLPPLPPLNPPVMVIAIHAYDLSSGIYSSGIRISSQVFNNLNTWM